MPTVSVELAADDILASPHAAMLVDAAGGPPYSVVFAVSLGRAWPDVAFSVYLDGHRLLMVRTTEPRLKAALQAIVAELS